MLAFTGACSSCSSISIHGKSYEERHGLLMSYAHAQCVDAPYAHAPKKWLACSLIEPVRVSLLEPVEA